MIQIPYLEFAQDTNRSTITSSLCCPLTLSFTPYNCLPFALDHQPSCVLQFVCYASTPAPNTFLYLVFQVSLSSTHLLHSYLFILF